MKKTKFKRGNIAILGRPNVGKSTLLNALVNQKVAIVSPKPQTTRSQIKAFYEDDRGQMFFLDTPGFYDANNSSTRFNGIIKQSINDADLILYVVDKTRKWGKEESQIFKFIQNSKVPKILVINKSDLKKHDHTELYLLQLEDDIQDQITVSALNHTHIEGLRQKIYNLLPENDRDDSVDNAVTPLLSQNSFEYIAELVREKIYLHTGQEIPYQTSARITDINSDDPEHIRIKGEIIVYDSHYKPMLIGQNGQKVRQIGNATAKDLAFMTNKKVRVRLKVVVEK